MKKRERIKSIIKNIYFYSENISIFNLLIDETYKNKKFRNYIKKNIYCSGIKEEAVKINYSFKDEKEKFLAVQSQFKDFFTDKDFEEIANKLSLIYKEKIAHEIYSIASFFGYEDVHEDFEKFMNQYLEKSAYKRADLDNLVKIENMYTTLFYDKCVKNKNMISLFDHLCSNGEINSLHKDKVNMIAEFFVKNYDSSKECLDILLSARGGREMFISEIYSRIEEKMANNN